jgi:plasmid stabilization system protein ParE
MTEYSIVVSEAALGDILDAQEWYDDKREGLSVDFEFCLEGGYEDILNNPLGFQIKYKNIRVKYIYRFPYGIHYFVENNRIYVLGVFHTSKNPKKWIERTSSN